MKDDNTLEFKTMSPKKVSFIYDVSRWTLYSWLLKREFPIYKIGRKVLIPVDEFEKFLNKHRVEAGGR